MIIVTDLVSLKSYNTQATSKGSDQTARMRRLIWGFDGLTYHIDGNLMPWLIYIYWGKKVLQYILRIHSLEKIGLLIS